MADARRLSDDGHGMRYVRIPSALAHFVESAIEQALVRMQQDWPTFMSDDEQGQTMVIVMRDR